MKYYIKKEKDYNLKKTWGGFPPIIYIYGGIYSSLIAPDLEVNFKQLCHHLYNGDNVNELFNHLTEPSHVNLN